MRVGRRNALANHGKVDGLFRKTSRSRPSAVVELLDDLYEYFKRKRRGGET